MIPSCNVCGSRFSAPIYQSPGNRSLTSMSTLIEGGLAVFFCDSCGHMQTAELSDLQAYYQEEYEINIASDEDDQIYKVINGQPIYRADHQAETLMAKVGLRPGMRVLDYGCAKAPTLKKVLARHPEIEPFLFDVTEKYLPFWQRYPKPPHWAVYQLDASWQGTMDLVLSFYALEHISDLQGALVDIKQMLKPGGMFYFIVPDVYQNPADFIVADHINHFSRASLRRLLTTNGFERIEIDTKAHEAAYVVTACLADQAGGHAIAASADVEPLSESRAAAQALAAYWRQATEKIRELEARLSSQVMLAIYGAGFYGHFIAYCLSSLERVCCFIDQNPHLQGRSVLGRPVVRPQDLPSKVTHILVGLNPRIAPSAIAGIEAWRARDLTFFYL